MNKHSDIVKTMTLNSHRFDDPARCAVRVIHLDRVDRARNEAVDETGLNRLAQTFKALGDPTRLKILTALRRQEMCVCDLAAFTCLSESAVSHQLRRLKDMALVKPRREGQIVYYRLDDDHVAGLLDIALSHVKE
ncbi:MAG: metalloregulator ArsR/SmtB family transcription factor [Desulfobacterales bacterium]|jgi:DNA-binding transcriptional ArsR family regulator